MKKVAFGIFNTILLALACMGQASPETEQKPILFDKSDVVVIEDFILLNIKSESEYSEKVKRVIVLNNSNGSRFLHQAYSFDKNYRFKSFDIKVINNFGVKHYTKKDFEVKGAYDGYMIASDEKLMVLNIAAREYPCTIQLEYEAEAKGYILLPSWYAIANTVSLNYTLLCPAGYKLRYRTLNLEAIPSITTEGNKTTYKWLANNLKVPEGVENSYESGRVSPVINVVPGNFEYEGYKGEFNTWNDFGKWNYPLYNESNPFSDKRISEIKSLLAGHTTKEEKINVLYDYLKKNFRYVSVQLGIGGYRPFPVKFVDEKKYGDCKALTNYMRNLLAVAGIKAYPALINAGYNKYPADPKFPTDPFNHVILCVPDEKDSIWLECTSNNNKAGFLGSFTENKNALLLTEKGGILVKTPASNYKNNQIQTRSDIWLSEDGGGEVISHLYTTGDIYDFFDYYVAESNIEEQKKVFVKYLDYKQPDEFKISDKKDSADGESFLIGLSYDKIYDFKAGNKLFVPQRINELCSERLTRSLTRTVPYLFHYPYIKTDTSVYHLPNGTIPENIDEPFEKDCRYGSYKRTIQYDKEKKTITVVATLILKNHIVPADDYENVATFFNEVNSDEAQKIVLTKE
ncbi:MAG TPA: transglutaminase family protein [Candidatus Nitrosocosmicus sp.]